MAGKIGQGMTRFDDEKYHNRSKIQGNRNCKFFVNISIFLSHFFYFHGSKVRGYAHSVAQLQFPYKVGKIREPQAQFEKRPIRAVSKPASTALMHYKLRFE
ncbi:MAG: hypothetical protein ACLUTR_03420 [Ruminococcus bicirculans (ex Wegman et al. 2014)]|jgi:hypothetical protein|uniref:hypothetical protein n=2 Tax=Oscillospiraceae TaxID=216572 RepID=UPI001D026ADE|nr:hypothetical protein [Ruminococcus callidus]MCB5775047.1 hypothetical protein [Ruminococcus callidus]